MLDDTHMKMLRAPFTVAAVKFRPLERPNDKKQLGCLVYIDSRLAAERLSAVDPAWSSSYEVLAGPDQHMPVVCKLTVHGVTREGVGQNASPTKDDKHAKMAFSDALKRAAVEFGVAASLYAMPRFVVGEGGYWIGRNQKVGGITAAGLKTLRQQYLTAISAKEFVDRFGQPIDHGDYLVPEEDAADVPDVTAGEQEAATIARIDEREVEILCAIGLAMKPDTDVEKLRTRYADVPDADFEATLQAGLGAAVKTNVITKDQADAVADAVDNGATVDEIRTALTGEAVAA